MSRAREYARDRAWSDRFAEPVTAILRAHIPTMYQALLARGRVLADCRPGSELLDRHENTDFRIQLPPLDLRIACRVRQHKYLHYLDEFTVRVARPHGGRIEWEKVLAGYGDFSLYAFANPAGDRLLYWVLLDLDVLRCAAALRHTERRNADGTVFWAIQLSSLPEEAVVACSPNMPVSVC